MNKRDWLLLMIGNAMQPIQLQKALFIFSEESAVPRTESYSFAPYNWGPCSFDIYDDVRSLREDGYIETIPTGRGWSLYRLTSAGEEKTRDLREMANSATLSSLDEIRGWVVSRDFETLLKDVYRKYPKYSTESLFTQ